MDRKKAVQGMGVSPLKGGGYSYPPDEVNVLVLQHFFGEDLELTPACQAWFEACQAKAKSLLEIAEQSDAVIPVEYAQKLKPYQRVAIAFGIAAKKCIIADDRGLGKTLEAISICEALRLKRTLVVAPGYLKFGWQREVQNWVGDVGVVALGDRAIRTETIKQFWASNKRYLIVNYEMIRPNVNAGGYPELFNYRWDAVIFDEAHRLKGRDSQWTSGAKKLSSEYLFMCTGNPIANRPDEIWQLLNLIDPKRFSGYWNFVEYFCNIVDTFFGRDIAGVNKARLAQLQFVLQPYLIRRLKRDVAPWLPEKVNQIIEVELEGRQKTFYQRAEKEMILELQNGGIEIIDTVIALNIRLQQAIANPAILGGVDESCVEKAAIELIADLFDSGAKKIVVGLWFIEAVRLFSQKLAKKNMKHYIITGEIKAEKRDEIVENFKSDKEPCLLIGGIKAMSEGLNIDECDHIIFMDKSWTPLDNEQFVDRIHRMTSTRTKNSYHIVVKDSLSQDREEILQEKAEMIEEVLSMQAVARKLLQRTTRQ